MQDIVDLSAPILDNYIAINDASLKMMAYTKSIPCDDPICISFIKNGYHSEDFIRIFRENNLFKTWNTESAIFINDNCDVEKYPTLNKVFRFKNMYFAQAVMTCNRHPITPCLIDLFQIFIDILSVNIEHLCEEKITYHIYDNYLIDLIERKMTNGKMIEERAQYVGIPFSGRFFCVKSYQAIRRIYTSGKCSRSFPNGFPILSMCSISRA